MKLEGTFTALVTPFHDGQIDRPALRELVEWQISEGIHGLVACGSTGEAAALTLEERVLVVREVQDQARGRVPVVAGSGTNCTRTSVEFTRAMAALKVDAVLVVTPYYVKPTPAGLIEHYRQVAAVGVPVVAYNVPGRTGISMTADTVATLAGIQGLAALKEASGDLKLDGQMIRAAAGRLVLLSGDDFTYLPLLAVGGGGCISVVSNVAPRQTADLYNRWTRGDRAGALEVHQKLLPLMEALFLESNPIPVKAALAMMGKVGWEIRLPLTPLSESLRPRLAQVLDQTGVGRAKG